MATRTRRVAARPKATTRPRGNGAARREECILVLQGGGALGAYQAGVYEALAAMQQAPDWVAGISIGAINAALIAGNVPERRVERLREFWEGVSSFPFAPPALPPGLHSLDGARDAVNETNATMAMLFGVNGFFLPRIPAAPFQPPGTLAAISYYDTAPLKQTLERLIDFDLLNSDKVRLSVGAVNVTQRQLQVLRHRAPRPGHRRAPHHGERRAAAGLSADRDRRRVLLGRRPGLEHAAAVRARPAGTARAAGVPGRPVRRARRDAGDARRGERAREGHPLLEPDAPEHDLRAETPGDAAGGQAARRQAAGEPARATPTPRPWPRCRRRQRSRSCT